MRIKYLGERKKPSQIPTDPTYNINGRVTIANAQEAYRLRDEKKGLGLRTKISPGQYKFGRYTQFTVSWWPQ